MKLLWLAILLPACTDAGDDNMGPDAPIGGDGCALVANTAPSGRTIDAARRGCSVARPVAAPAASG
ncbi:MAG: hypothetical protein H0T46_25465 [Deltaproteobacteria bacterium]|nr:hypothetical protein [Deltaproteobacteria bacterium]